MNVFFSSSPLLFFLKSTQKKHTANFSVFLSVSPNTQTPTHCESRVREKRHQQQKASTASSFHSPNHIFDVKNLLQFSRVSLKLGVIKHISSIQVFFPLSETAKCTKWIGRWLWLQRSFFAFFCQSHEGTFRAKKFNFPCHGTWLTWELSFKFKKLFAFNYGSVA